MSVTIGAINNSAIDAYTERCTRFSENVRRLQERIQQFKEHFFGEEVEQEQFVTQEQEQFMAQESVMNESVNEQFSSAYQASASKEQKVMPEDIDIDALVSEIATNAQGLAM